MAKIDVILERPPIDFRSSGGGGGEGDGPNDQTPVKPSHPAEVGTGLALVRGPGGEMRKEILANITHGDLLAWGRAENATEVKWVTPRLASEQQVAVQKEKLARIVQMLIGLLRKFSDRADVLREEEPGYLVDHDHEQEHDW